MESPEGLANAILGARLTDAQRNAGGWERAYDRMQAAEKEASDITFYWASAFDAAMQLVSELGTRHPNDPLFQPTGQKNPDRSPELAYRRIFEQKLIQQLKRLPPSVGRGQALRDFMVRCLKKV
jgi:hypothetical protein